MHEKARREMNKKARNIAFALLVTFAFPITFQPAHILWHYAQRVRQGYQFDTSLYSGTVQTSINQQQHSCPICDYVLIINSLPEQTAFSNDIPKIKIELNESVRKLFIWHLPRINHSRAPPASTI
jgi:hypothetical protein